MPLRWFICPDGERTETADCLRSCRMGTRCMSRRFLTMAAEQRKWTGTPSTTQLLNGTMYSYLTITTDYAENPFNMVWAIHGTRTHAALEAYQDDALTEERLRDEVNSGQFDYYDAQDCTLWDTKTWGSYKVAKALGIVGRDEQTGERYKTGAKSGQIKTRKVYEQTGEPNLHNEILQMNDYRIKLEAAGFPVKALKIEAIVRDGGTIAANSRGVTEPYYVIDVPIVDDVVVKQYLGNKAFHLGWALENGWDKPCDSEESWDGVRCARFCPVSEECKRRVKS